MAFPAPHVIEAGVEHRYTLILLHGRDSNGEEFEEELREGQTSAGESMLDQLSPYCKLIFPNARVRFSTIFKQNMQEWFESYSLVNPEAEWERQVDGLRESVDYVLGIVEEEMEILCPNRIILGGISQGFATASHVLLNLSTSIGGFVGLSGWMPYSAAPIVQSPRSIDTPVYISHSKDDAIVEACHGEAAFTRLSDLDYRTQFRSYNVSGHWIQEPQGYDDLSAFLQSCWRNA